MKNPRISDEEVGLIKRAQAGDESAFSKLYAMYEQYVLHVIRKYTRDDDTAKYLTVETFIDVYENLSQFKDYSSFKGWVGTIASRNAIDYLRSEKHGVENVVGDDRLSFIDNISGENELGVVDQITFNQVHEEFKKLPYQHMRICELFYVSELTALQISKKLNIPIGTVKSVLSRVRRRLKNHFN